MDRAVRRVLGALLCATLVASTAACHGSGSSATDPQDVLATSKRLLDDTAGVRLALTTKGLPSGVDGLTGATGVGTHAPAFRGTVVLLVNRLSLTVPVVAVDGVVLAKLPFTKRYAEVDPADYGAPDPASLMDTTKGLSSWLTQATDVERGDRVRSGDQVLTSYSGVLPGKAVVGVIPSADVSSDFPVTFRVAEDGQLRSVDVSGPFYGKGADVKYAVRLSGYGTAEHITRP